jgi:hypothetical protein
MDSLLAMKYKKICSVLGGMYIDVADKSVNLNPFQVSHDLNKSYADDTTCINAGLALRDSNSSTTNGLSCHVFLLTPLNDLNKSYAESDEHSYDEVDKGHDIETIAMILGEMRIVLPCVLTNAIEQIAIITCCAKGAKIKCIFDFDLT